MKEIAIYGKGGIGKSTISANLSAAFALNGKKVLQAGCDPKHDSTRLLLHGKAHQTVLDYLKDRSPDNCRADDIVAAGYAGVHCVEAGGPEPGVGCAGRGILTTFELLDRLGVRDAGYDLILYDVLGDVVCGGFAVPMRREYADQVYIVTSGEFMSIYAANNILRGLKNYDYEKHRAGGIIFNARNVEGEYDRVHRFAQAVGLPILAEIPRDDLFAQSERQGCCLLEAFPQTKTAQIFTALARQISETADLYPARPLEDDQLEQVVLERAPVSFREKAETVHFDKTPEEVKECFFSKNLMEREPLHGCAFSGAAGIAVMVKDSAVLAHGPASCAHITYQSISSVGRNMLLERGIVMPMQTTPPIISSEMSEGIMIFGGIEELKQKLRKLIQEAPKVIFVLTTCPSGIIGEDVKAVERLSNEKTQVVLIQTDGNIIGDYLQGIIEAYVTIGRSLIDPKVLPEPDTVNLIAEKMVAYVTPVNYKNIKDLLNALGLRINCRFLYETGVEEIRNFKKGSLNLLAYDDHMGRTIRDFLEKEYEASFLDQAFPVGFEESVQWLRDVAAHFNKSEKAEAIIQSYKTLYTEEIAKMKPYLKGKKLMIVTYNHQIEWILKTAVDLEMTIVLTGILNFSQDSAFTTAYQEVIEELVMDYDQNRRRDDIRRLQPDLLIANYISNDLDGKICTDTIPLCPEAGFLSGINLAKRWCDLFKLDLKEGWRNDEVLYRKYFA